MRHTDQLTPLDHAMLEAMSRLHAEGVLEIHAYALTKLLEGPQGDRRWIGYGSQYRAMSHLTERGFVSAHWEDPTLAEAEKRPRRRLYAITPSGEQALTRVPAFRPVPRFVGRFAST